MSKKGHYFDRPKSWMNSLRGMSLKNLLKNAIRGRGMERMEGKRESVCVAVRTQNKEQRTKNNEQRTKNKEQLTRNNAQRTKSSDLQFTARRITRSRAVVDVRVRRTARCALGAWAALSRRHSPRTRLPEYPRQVMLPLPSSLR